VVASARAAVFARSSLSTSEVAREVSDMDASLPRPTIRFRRPGIRAAWQPLA
jgi:hypothetical protein